ncbi:MAG: LysR family transcriptional regulator [Gammaproteobacteria bacterium]|nr:LysR family transcriptional regulator [Gammaproteobacteria bacterium]MBI5616698.1 LysR family transcriptional regulator [Gammaproteobacteria bacterium]
MPAQNAASLLKNLSLRQLRYFREVAELHSFTRAAEVLHVAQSALSRQIRMLEEALGVVLFNRLDRGVTLTAAGERLRDRVTALLKDLDAMRAEVTDTTVVPRGELAVGMPPSLREILTVPLMAQYYRSWPQVSLHVQEGISIELTKLVQDGQLDCAIVVDLMAVPRLTATPLVREQLCLIGPRQARLSPRRPVSLARAAAGPLILTRRPNSLRLVVENALAAARLPANIVAESNSTAVMVELAADGLASTVLPYSAAWKAIGERRLTAAPIAGLGVEWVFVHPASRPLSLAALAYLRGFHELARERIAGRSWLGAALCHAEPPSQFEI